ncbi:MAG: endonuclease III [Clostridia bacterium]|nr:endonuclease III [Clostridia bacterium]
MFPDSKCSLNHEGDVWKLLVMGRLSAQCTDARVNEVCNTLFREIPDVYAMAAADLEKIEKLIFTCGLYRTKAKSLKEMALEITKKHNGKVPDNFKDLVALSGVGSKIANLVLGDYFGKGGIVADTHCIRISNRLGFVKSTNQAVVERTLDPLVPKDEQSDYCHRMVDFGRSVCTAKNPACDECPLRKEKLCSFKYK